MHSQSRCHQKDAEKKSKIHKAWSNNCEVTWLPLSVSSQASSWGPLLSLFSLYWPCLLSASSFVTHGLLGPPNCQETCGLPGALYTALPLMVNLAQAQLLWRYTEGKNIETKEVKRCINMMQVKLSRNTKLHLANLRGGVTNKSKLNFKVAALRRTWQHEILSDGGFWFKGVLDQEIHKDIKKKHLIVINRCFQRFYLYFTFTLLFYVKINACASFFFLLVCFKYSISKLNFGLNHQSVSLINISHFSHPTTDLCPL